MVEACLLHKSESAAWMVVAYEVVDVCGKVLDWRCASGHEERTYASMYYFMLLEEICKVEGSSELQSRKQQILEDIVTRFESNSWDTCSIPNEFTRNQAALLISKYWIPQTEDSLLNMLEVIKVRMFSSEMKGIIESSSI